MGEPDMDLCSEIFCPSMSTSVRKASSPRMDMRLRPWEPSFCICTPGTSSRSSPTVRAPERRTSSAVITVTLMGTCCSSFSTLVAVTYTSPAFTASSAWAYGTPDSAQARTAKDAAHVVDFIFIIQSLSLAFPLGKRTYMQGAPLVAPCAATLPCPPGRAAVHYLCSSSVCFRKSCRSWERFTCQNWPASVSTIAPSRISTSPARVHCSSRGASAATTST